MAAQKKLLELLSIFSEVWISAFGFTLQPMFDKLKKADKAGAKIHVLLDHSVWAQAFIKQFETHRAWARANEPQYQIS